VKIISDKIKLDGMLISLSESTDGTSLEGKFLICPLDEANANGVGLRDVDLTDDEKKGLENQPVVCKVIKNAQGKYDFTGHNLKVKYEKNENGQLVKKYEFDTNPIGFHTSASVEEIEIDGIKKKCIVATAKLWTRYDKAISALARILDEKKSIKTSWEISYADSYTEDGTKWLKSIVWLGNCVLGEFIEPAYKNAGLIELSEEDQEIQIAMAFTEDLINEENNNYQEVSNLEITNDNIVNSEVENLETNNQEINVVSQIDDNDSIDDINIAQGGNDMPENGKEVVTVVTEVSALTDNDLYTKVRRAINNSDSSKWYYIARLYPYEYKAYAYEWDRESEDHYVEFSYTVNSDDTISINSQKEVLMMFIPRVDYETQISQLTEKLSSTEKELIEAGKAVSELTKGKEDFETQISELTVYKEKVLELEKAEQERELAEKKLQLKSFATEDNLIESAELESNEQIVTIFAELTLENYEVCQEKIELIKGRKAIEKFKLSKNNVDSNTDTANKTEVEVSAIDNTNVKTNLNDDEDEVSPTSVMKLFLNNK